MKSQPSKGLTALACVPPLDAEGFAEGSHSSSVRMTSVRFLVQLNDCGAHCFQARCYVQCASICEGQRLSLSGSPLATSDIETRFEAGLRVRMLLQNCIRASRFRKSENSAQLIEIGPFTADK